VAAQIRANADSYDVTGAHVGAPARPSGREGAGNQRDALMKLADTSSRELLRFTNSRWNARFIMRKRTA
jgi:hypothetical protein